MSPGASLRTLSAEPPSNPRTGQAASDAGIALLVRQGDPRGATLVWNRYAGMVRGVVYRAAGGHETEDLVQEVFAGLFKNPAMLREPSALRPFLVSIAMRKARTALRRRRAGSWLRLSNNGTLPEVLTEDAGPGLREAVRRLYEILDDLDARGRLAFVLRHAEGYQLTEVATALGVSLATVKRALARAEAHVHRRARNDDILCAWTEEVRDA